MNDDAEWVRRAVREFRARLGFDMVGSLIRSWHERARQNFREWLDRLSQRLRSNPAAMPNRARRVPFAATKPRHQHAKQL
jgi:hypothetical protein